MGCETSFRSKAAHFVTDLTTVLLNPISSDEHSRPLLIQHASAFRVVRILQFREDDESLALNLPMYPPREDEVGISSQENLVGGDSKVPVDGPDTSSFTAFLVSLLSSSEPGKDPSKEFGDYHSEIAEAISESGNRESSGKRSLISIGKQSLGRAISKAARLGGYRHKTTDKKVDHILPDPKECKSIGFGLKPIKELKEAVYYHNLPEMSEPSLLLSENTRNALYMALPALVRERKWVLLYSTWRHGISLSTLYRRSVLCPGHSLLVVGDRKGAVFGGLVEVPLRPTNKRKYQGTNSTFVFTNISSHPIIFRPTGANRYFTLCSTDFLALGGGGHFALYLDGDLLSGSSSSSETFGNSCLAHTEDFDVKEVELWGFAYGSKYEETLALCRTEVPGICRW